MKEDIMLTSQITVHNNFIFKVNTILGVAGGKKTEEGGGGIMESHWQYFCGDQTLLISVSRAIQARLKKDESSNSFYSWSDV